MPVFNVQPSGETPLGTQVRHMPDFGAVPAPIGTPLPFVGTDDERASRALAGMQALYPKMQITCDNWLLWGTGADTQLLVHGYLTQMTGELPEDDTGDPGTPGAIASAELNQIITAHCQRVRARKASASYGAPATRFGNGMMPMFGSNLGSSSLGLSSFGSFGSKSSTKPSGSISSWWNSEPIVFTSKNYVVGGAIGLAVGALAMHLSMKKKR